MYHIPHNIYAMPVGLLAALALLATPDAVGGHAEVGDRRAICGVAHLGHRAHVADQLDAVDGVVGCHWLCLLYGRSSAACDVLMAQGRAGAKRGGCHRARSVHLDPMRSPRRCYSAATKHHELA
jgi:hypothetical protein